jgi:hypothetical protein
MHRCQLEVQCMQNKPIFVGELLGNFKAFDVCCAVIGINVVCRCIWCIVCLATGMVRMYS